jgi:ribonuclease HI
MLEAVDGSAKFEVCDQEQDVEGERLELLAVVRGLEALDQPSRVTLVTPSRYVSHGLRYGLAGWRESGWQWERFGKMTAIKNSDLWQRIDKALQYHDVICRTWRFDPQPESATPRRSAQQQVTRTTPRPSTARPPQPRTVRPPHAAYEPLFGRILQALSRLFPRRGDCFQLPSTA